jgi:hypothetical protein
VHVEAIAADASNRNHKSAEVAPTSVTNGIPLTAVGVHDRR